MTPSIKPEVYKLNVSTPKEEDRAVAICNMHKNLTKVGRVVPKICSLTHRHTQTNTSQCCAPIEEGAAEKMYAWLYAKRMDDCSRLGAYNERVILKSDEE